MTVGALGASHQDCLRYPKSISVSLDFEGIWAEGGYAPLKGVPVEGGVEGASPGVDEIAEWERCEKRGGRKGHGFDPTPIHQMRREATEPRCLSALLWMPG